MISFTTIRYQLIRDISMSTPKSDFPTISLCEMKCRKPVACPASDCNGAPVKAADPASAVAASSAPCAAGSEPATVSVAAAASTAGGDNPATAPSAAAEAVASATWASD